MGKNYQIQKIKPEMAGTKADNNVTAMNTTRSNIVFVVPRDLGISGFPFGIAILSAILKQHGYHVNIVDANAYSLSEDEVVTQIGNLQPSLIGFTGLLSNYAFLRSVSLLLREKIPSIPQIAGGWWTCSVPGVVLEETGVNVVVQGEADNIIADLCDSVINNGDLSSIPGLCYLDAKGDYCNTGSPPYPQNLDQLPLPAYDLFNMNYYIISREFWEDMFLDKSYWDSSSFRDKFGDETRWVRANMYSGRGCYGNCTFCCAAGVTRRNHSPSYVVDHMEEMNRRFGVNYFRFTESLTISTRKWTKEFCREIISRDLKILYWAQLRGDFNFDDECLELLKQSGCYHVTIGFESGNDYMLQRMRKNITTKKYYEVIKALRKHKIWVIGNFILNMPGESTLSLKDTLKFVKKTKLVLENPTLAVPNPGAELYEYAKDNCFITDEKELFLDNPGKTYNLANFQAYIRNYSFNNLPPEILLKTANNLTELANINWFYEKNRFLYWCFYFFPFLMNVVNIALLRKAITRQQKTGIIRQSLQALRLLLMGGITKWGGKAKSLLPGRLVRIR